LKRKEWVREEKSTAMSQGSSGEKGKLEKISLVDGHAHLDELEDLSASIREAKEAGVDQSNIEMVW
jgi:hypothetical protein